MATSGTQTTLTFSGAKEAEDISEIEEIIIVRMTGAGGGSSDPYQGDDGTTSGGGGSGGQIEYAVLNVESESTAEIWVGGAGGTSGGGFGRSNGGNGETVSGEADGGGGGGSTEIVVDGEFVAAADAGGGGGSDSASGGGGARGGGGGVGAGDGEGDGFGGAGGSSLYPDGGDGGQELGTATLLNSGTTTAGGGSNTNGEIVINYDKPLPPTSVSLTEELNTLGPSLTVSWTGDGVDRKNTIYRSDAASPTYPDDFSAIGEAAAGKETFNDDPPQYEREYTYRVTASVNGGESDPSPPATITTSSPGELEVTITGTNSPANSGDTLEITVDVENVGDYRADEDIEAILDPQ